MARWRCFSRGIFFMLVVLPAAASAEMWLCPLPTGSAIYTNIPKTIKTARLLSQNPACRCLRRTASLFHRVLRGLSCR